MARTRVLLVALVLGALLLGGAAWAMLSAMHRGATVQYCQVTAALEAAEAALDVPPEVLADFPALDEAMAEATEGAAGLARLPSCEARDELLAALEAAGAPRGTAGGHLLRHEGQTYRVEVVKAVA